MNTDSGAIRPGDAHAASWQSVKALLRFPQPDPERRRETLTALLLLALFVFSWRSVGLTRFNGLDTPLFLALGAFCLWRLARVPVTVDRPLLSAYLLWAGWVLFADVYSAQFAEAFARDAHWLVLPLFALLCAGFLRETPAAVPLLRLGAAASVFWITALLVLDAHEIRSWIEEPAFGHVRHLSLALGLLAIWLYDDGRLGGWPGLVIGAARVTALAVLCWAGGRGVLLALAAAVAVHAWLAGTPRARVIRYAIEAVAAALASELASAGHALMGLANSLSRTLAADSLDALSSARITLWRETWAGLREGYGLWFGWGGNGYIRMGLARGFIFHPHNVILQMLTDWGAIGLALFANFLRAGVRPLAGLDFRTPGTALAAAILVYLLITGMIDGGLYHLQLLIGAGLALGLLLAQRRDREARPAVLLASPVLLVLAMLLVHLG